jgi:hypothetical protein
LMIAFGLFVIDSRLPDCCITAVPLTTTGFVGFATAIPDAKHDATASEISLRLKTTLEYWVRFDMIAT